MTESRIAYIPDTFTDRAIAAGVFTFDQLKVLSAHIAVTIPMTRIPRWPDQSFEASVEVLNEFVNLPAPEHVPSTPLLVPPPRTTKAAPPRKLTVSHHRSYAINDRVDGIYVKPKSGKYPAPTGWYVGTVTRLVNEHRAEVLFDATPTCKAYTENVSVIRLRQHVEGCAFEPIADVDAAIVANALPVAAEPIVEPVAEVKAEEHVEEPVAKPAKKARKAKTVEAVAEPIVVVKTVKAPSKRKAKATTKDLAIA